MKQFILVIGLAVIAMLVSMTLLSVQTKSDRQTDLDRAVAASVKQTVKATQAGGQKEIKSNKDMVAYFVNVLSTNIKSEGDINIKVMGVDYKDGLLDVKVTQSYKYLNGKKGSVSIRKCAIYE